MRLALRFALTLAAVITLALAFSAYWRVLREVELFEDEIVRDAKTMGRILGPLVGETWEREGEERAKQLVASTNEREAVRIRLVFLDEQTPGNPTLSSDERGRLSAEGILVKKTYDALTDADVEFLVTYVTLPPPLPAHATLEFAEPLDGEQAYVQRTIVWAAVLMLTLALFCGLVTIALGVFFIGRPVRALVAQARRIGSGDFSDRLGLRQRDEIGELALEFDAMSDRLAKARDGLAKANEAKLDALEQLRHVERVATVGKLAAGIAHELGTPLQVISGTARLIAEDPDASADARDNAAIVDEQAGRMTGIIRQLLDFARRGVSARAATDLAELVERAVKLLAPLAEESNVTLRLVGVERTLVSAVDAEQLLQVVSNLVVNAVQAMPDGGIVEIGLGSGWMTRGGKREACAKIHVRDSGLGMSKEVRDHAFEPFFTTKGAGGGTGLGLSVAVGIVEDHGGSIELESEPDHGCLFVVSLPLDHDAERAEAAR